MKRGGEKIIQKKSSGAKVSHYGMYKYLTRLSLPYDGAPCGPCRGVHRGEETFGRGRSYTYRDLLWSHEVEWSYKKNHKIIATYLYIYIFIYISLYSLVIFSFLRAVHAAVTFSGVTSYWARKHWGRGGGVAYRTYRQGDGWRGGDRKWMQQGVTGNGALHPGILRGDWRDRASGVEILGRLCLFHIGFSRWLL